IYNNPQTVYMIYDTRADAWTISTTEISNYWIKMELFEDSWKMSHVSKELIVHSDQTKFWINNNNEKTITYDTFNTNLDQIVILAANTGYIDSGPDNFVK